MAVRLGGIESGQSKYSYQIITKFTPMVSAGQIEYGCPRCFTQMTDPTESVGREVACPKCKESLLVPLPGDRLAVIIGTILPPRLEPLSSGTCPLCQKKVKLSPQFFGKRVQCKSCSGGFGISSHGVPFDESKTSRLRLLMADLEQTPVAPKHLMVLKQLEYLQDCRCVDYLCKLLFSIRRDEVRFLSVTEPWLRRRLDEKEILYLDAWCREYRDIHEKGFLHLVFDGSFRREENEFFADLELRVVKALISLGDRRCVRALKDKMKSVIEYRDHSTDDADVHLQLRFSDPKDQPVFDQLTGFVGFGSQSKKSESAGRNDGSARS